MACHCLGTFWLDSVQIFLWFFSSVSSLFLCGHPHNAPRPSHRKGPVQERQGHFYKIRCAIVLGCVWGRGRGRCCSGMRGAGLSTRWPLSFDLGPSQANRKIQGMEPELTLNIFGPFLAGLPPKGHTPAWPGVASNGKKHHAQEWPGQTPKVSK